MLFNAFSPLNGGALDTYQYPAEHPYDLDASLDYTRPATGVASWPQPVILGYVDGFIPQQNALEYSLMLGQGPIGPNVGLHSPYAQMFPNIMGSLSKVSG
jgi:hypothetical protein